MAKQKNMYYVGRKGNIVYYELNGGFYMRSVPIVVRQTAATQQRSSNFAIAVGASRVLRSLLLPALPFPKDKKMQNSFGGAIMKWLKLQTLPQLETAVNLPYIQGFQFNDKTDLRSRLKIPIRVIKVAGSLLQLHLPTFVPVGKIETPAGTVSVQCTIAAASCTLGNSLSNGNATNTFNIPYTSDEFPSRVVNLPVAMPSGSLVVVVFSFSCVVSIKGKNETSNNKVFMPSGIVSAMYF